MIHGGAGGSSLRTLAELSGATPIGDPALNLLGVATLEAAGPDQLALFHHPRYREAFAKTRAGAVVVRKRVAEGLTGPRSFALLVTEDPYLAFAKISAHFHPPTQLPAAIDPRAAVDATAVVHATAFVGPFAFVGAGARIGARTNLLPFSYVGPEASVGSDCRLHPGSVVAERCLLGDRVTLQPGAIVGSDGFGYAFDPVGDRSGPAHRKVPQIGIARLEDDVEIGANSCVDRATFGETVIGRGSKLDNQVQVAHNVRVGPLSILCAQVGIAGSATIGQGVVMGGQVGIVGHIQIGDGAKIGAKSGVMSDVAAGDQQSGAPARPHSRFLRQFAAEQRLPEMLRRIAALEARLQQLGSPEEQPQARSRKTVRSDEE